MLGGEAIRAGGGVIGFLLGIGVVSSAIAATDLGRDFLGPVWAPVALFGGIGCVVLGVIGFWVIGWIARVPMWLQAPSPGAPRRYVRGRAERPEDREIPNRLDGRD